MVSIKLMTAAALAAAVGVGGGAGYLMPTYVSVHSDCPRNPESTKQLERARAFGTIELLPAAMQKLGCEEQERIGRNPEAVEEFPTPTGFKQIWHLEIKKNGVWMKTYSMDVDS